MAKAILKMDKLAVLLAAGGVWIFSDGLYSLLLYLNKPGYLGAPQTWLRDHWIRCIRMAWGLVFVGVAWRLAGG